MPKTPQSVTLSNVTLYLGTEMAVRRIDCRSLDITRPFQYAQYDNAVNLTFIPKGKRSPCERFLSPKSFFYVLPTPLAIEPAGMFGPATTTADGVQMAQSRYISCDPRWVSDFLAELDKWPGRQPWACNGDDLNSRGIGCGRLGNGLSVWDRTREADREYLKVAHIGDDGTLSLYDTSRDDVTALLGAEAARMRQLHAVA